MNLNGIAPDELIVDNFAGGGGASTAIEQALGRPIDIAINHDREAIAMHTINHPRTRHLCENVWKVDIAQEINGRKVGLAWFSPDCCHFSKAKGGKPVKREIRGLAWAALRWAGKLKGHSKPRVIMLENVEEFQTWGPVVNGQPCKRRAGMTFKRWVTQLRTLGYVVEWREVRACDHGAPTIRKRLFIVARRDGLPIIWPEPTYAKEGDLFLKPFRTAADCIDWSVPCHSIFLNKEEGRRVGVNRPLAEATMKRIARGVMRYVINSNDPFIVNLTHHGSDRTESVREPFRTVTGAKRGEKAIVVPHLTRFNENGTGQDLRDPIDTVMAGATRFGLVGTCQDGQRVDEPAPTISAQGTHIAEVRAFLVKYFGTGGGQNPGDPLHTISTRDRFGLVTVKGEDYVIVDIGMRMLRPRELFLAQGFPSSYIIDRGIDPTTGEEIKLSKTAQIRMCGNSVSPPPAEVLVRAQFGLPAAH